MFRDEELDGLAQAALRIVEERPAGRLVALIVRIPPNLDADQFRRVFDQHLSVVGLDFVDLAVDDHRGPMRIVAADFHTA